MFFSPEVGFCNLGTYAGLGSRKISRYRSVEQVEFAFCMTLFGFQLNAGAADGSDTSYEFGAKLAYDFLSDYYNLPKKEYARVMSIFMPWKGFNGRPVTSEYIDTISPLAHEISAKFHPNWDGLTDPAVKMMVRNVHQVKGIDLNSNVNFVACHTDDGAYNASMTSYKTGGTGQAIRIADHLKIKIFNTGFKEHDDQLKRRVINARRLIKEKFGLDVEQHVKLAIEGYMPIQKTTSSDFINDMKNGVYDILIHGANCQNAMGSGFAERIKLELNEAYQADLKTKKGDRKKLGKYTFAKITRNNRQFTVINAYTQFRWGRAEKLHCDYDAIRKSLKLINKEFPQGRILLPRIGSGLANGCWITTSNIIKTELRGRDYCLFNFNEKEYNNELYKKNNNEQLCLI